MAPPPHAPPPSGTGTGTGVAAGPWHHLVDAAALRDALGDGAAAPALVVLDCRHDLADPDAGRHAYEAGHIPGAVHAHIDRDLSGPVAETTGRHPLPDPDAFRRTMGRLGIGPDTQVVAYDDKGGAFAARAWWLLRHYGHGHVAVLDGGIQAWQATGGDLREGPEENPPQTFLGTPGHTPTVDHDSIRGRLPAAPGTLLDARGPARYRGDEEPIDPKAGHIPGALNLPFADNLGPDGRFRPVDELQARFRDALHGRTPDQAAVYCGSGVTACHDLLAMEHAGLHGAALYPGSWSEWCRDDDRPVETGDPKPDVEAGA